MEREDQGMQVLGGEAAEAGSSQELPGQVLALWQDEGWCGSEARLGCSSVWVFYAPALCNLKF